MTQIRGYTITHPVPDELSIERSRKTALMPFLFLSVFILFWYGGIIFGAVDPRDGALIDQLIQLFSEEPVLLIFMIVPGVFLIPHIWKNGRVLFSGESFNFNGGRGIIERNGRYFSSFDEIDAVVLSGRDRKLSLRRRSGKAHPVIHSGNPTTVRPFAETLSKLLGCPVNRAASKLATRR